MKGAKGIVVFGATSTIATEILKLYTAHKYAMFLVGRDESKLEALGKLMSDLGAPSVQTYSMDFSNFENVEGVVEGIFESLSRVDVVLIAHGTLPDNRIAAGNAVESWHEIKVNVISTISILNEVANRIERKGEGTIAVITSVAGDRLRASNYFYGSMKKMISVYLDSLRMRFRNSAINVVNLKLGPEDTPMTQRFEKGMFWSKPEDVAGAIFKSINYGSGEKYIPRYWKWIMIFIKLIPNPIFKRLRI